MEKQKQKRISEVIKDDYKLWQNESIIIDAATNTGKTTFILQTLVPYAQEQHKNLLFLTNRRKLYDDISAKVKQNYYDNIKVMTYQALQLAIRKHEDIPYYDYIVCDEAHYFTSDATFNDYTDLSYDFVMRQDCVKIFMSATGSKLFRQLQSDGIVSPNRVYKLAKNVDYITSVYLYKKDQIQNLIEDILAQSQTEKILVFVNSTQRLVEMHKIFGDAASYMANRPSEKSNKQKYDELSFVESAIKDNRFEKRILFATKIIDNGVDIIDPELKHIFIETFDVDTTIQAIGRKRPIDENDTTDIYLLNYSKKSVMQFRVNAYKQLYPVDIYLADKKGFFARQDYQELIRSTHIFKYACDNTNIQLVVNQMAYRKYMCDMRMCDRMIYRFDHYKTKDGYQHVLMQELGDGFIDKIQPLPRVQTNRDLFLKYLAEIEGTKLMTEGKKELKQNFTDLIGLRDRTMGLNTLNGRLKDGRMPYQIVKGKDSKGRYWMIHHI